MEDQNQEVSILGVVIKKNMPIPEGNTGGRSAEIPKILGALEVGDYVFFPESDTRFKRDKAYTYGQRSGKKFLVKKMSEAQKDGTLIFGLGVWRTE